MKPFDLELFKSKLKKPEEIVGGEGFFSYAYLPYRDSCPSKTVKKVGYQDSHLRDLGYQDQIKEVATFKSLNFYSQVFIFPQNLEESTNKQKEVIENQKENFLQELIKIIEELNGKDLAIVVTLPSTAQTKKEIIEEDRNKYGGAEAKFIDHGVCVFINSDKQAIMVKDSLSGQIKDDGTSVEFSKELIEAIRKATGKGYEITEDKKEQQKRGEMTCNLWSHVNLYALANDMEMPSRDDIDKLESHNLKTFAEVEKLAFTQVAEIFRDKLVEKSKLPKELFEIEVLKKILESFKILAEKPLERKVNEIVVEIEKGEKDQNSLKNILDKLINPNSSLSSSVHINLSNQQSSNHK